MPHEKPYDKIRGQSLDMVLPTGKTCNDCVHYELTCEWMLSRDGTEDSCDWSPSKFRIKDSARQ